MADDEFFHYYPQITIKINASENPGGVDKQGNIFSGNIMSNTSNGSNTMKIIKTLDPTHCIFKIDSFSMLSEPLESNTFEAGGFRWRLVLYPSKHVKGNSARQIPLLLRIIDTGSFPECWNVRAFFRFFVCDQTTGKYLMIQEPLGEEIKCFREIKKEHEMVRFLSFEEFSDPSKGYLVEDSCCFGAEVFVISPSKTFTPVELTSDGTFLFTIENFSKLQKKGARVISKPIPAGGTNWILEVYPNGYSNSQNRSLSIFLCLHEPWNVPANKHWQVDFTLVLRHVESAAKTVSKRYPQGTNNFNYMHFVCGSQDFVSLERMSEALAFVHDGDKVLIQVKFYSITMKERFIE